MIHACLINITPQRMVSPEKQNTRTISCDAIVMLNYEGNDAIVMLRREVYVMLS